MLKWREWCLGRFSMSFGCGILKFKSKVYVNILKFFSWASHLQSLIMESIAKKCHGGQVRTKAKTSNKTSRKSLPVSFSLGFMWRTNNLNSHLQNFCPKSHLNGEYQTAQYQALIYSVSQHWKIRALAFARLTRGNCLPNKT